jgi:glyoxylase-like metal-dependent hydrolase (beta-lactamase superfamily II)
MKIAERWFQRRTLSEGITLLWEPHVHPLLRCNIWHVRGRDRDLLIDTGLGISSLAAEIADLVDRPLLAVATHIHYDHVGSLHEFAERAMHPLEAPRMADYREFDSLCTEDFPPGFLGDYADAPEFDRHLISAAPAGFRVEDFRIRSSPVTRLLDEGDVVDLGDRHFSVLHLPGHSPGSIGLYEPATETLFSGDAIYDGVLLDELPDSSIPDYLRSLERLRALRVRIVHGGHEPSFDGARLRVLIDEYVRART